MKWRHVSSDPALEEQEKIKRVLRRALGFTYEQVISEEQLDAAATRLRALPVIESGTLAEIAQELVGNPELFRGAEANLNAVLAEARGEVPPTPPAKHTTS